MEHIKEPKGVDLVITGKPLTETQKAIREFIKADKERLENRKVFKAKTSSKKKVDVI